MFCLRLSLRRCVLVLPCLPSSSSSSSHRSLDLVLSLSPFLSPGLGLSPSPS